MARRNSTEILLSKLHINTENPRYDGTADQLQAIKAILADQDEKIVNLAADIVNNGLNPAELSLVSPSISEKGFFNVLEGNRRVTALKLLDNPDLALPEYKNVASKIRSLKKNYKVIKKVPCVLFDSPEDANHWIKLKHTGENEGVGVVRWDSQQVARFESRNGGGSNIAFQTIEFLKSSKFADEKLKAKLSQLPITNLDRLLSDKSVQDLLGVSINKKQLRTDVDEAEIVKGLTKIVDDLVSKKVRVKDIYTKRDREKYIETFKKNEVPQKAQKAPEPWELSGGAKAAPVAASASKVSKKSRPLSTSRRNIIPRDCIIQIKEKKINKIYHELKNLDCDEFANAAAVLLRVFLELCCDAYLAKFKIRTLGQGSELHKKIHGIAQEFETQSVLEKNDLKGIRTVTSNHNSILSTNTFNSYVHNKSFSPIPNDLKITWDNIQPFIEKLWEKIG